MRTWWAGVQPPDSVRTPTFWGPAVQIGEVGPDLGGWSGCGGRRRELVGQMGEVGTCARGWRASNPPILSQPSLSGVSPRR